MRWWWGALCTIPTCLVGFFIVPAHWNNCLRVHMLPHSQTLSWFRTTQSLLFLLNAECLAEKQHISAKWVNRIRKSKDRQHKGQNEKDKRTNNDLQNITHTTNDLVTKISQTTGCELCVYIDMVQKQIEKYISIVDLKMIDKSLSHISCI